MKIVHADGHALTREGLHHILQHGDAGLEFLEAHTIPVALDLLARHDDIDLVLLDLDLAGRHDFSGFKKIWDSNPAIPIVILSPSEDPDDIKAAIDLGAAGYIPKFVTGQMLLAALKLVMDGGIYAPRIRLCRETARRARGEEPQSELTKRQREVLALMAEGLPNKLIARKLFVSEATVKGHVTAILNTLQVSNRVQAINKARQSVPRFRATVGAAFDALSMAG